MAAAGAPAAGEDGGGILHSLTARGESLAAFDGRCIPAGCVAPRSNTPGILGRRALPAGRLARLGATPDFHHGLSSLRRTSGDRCSRLPSRLQAGELRGASTRQRRYSDPFRLYPPLLRRTSSVLAIAGASNGM